MDPSFVSLSPAAAAAAPSHHPEGGRRRAVPPPDFSDSPHPSHAPHHPPAHHTSEEDPEDPEYSTEDDDDDAEGYVDMHNVLEAVSELAGLYLGTEEGETLVDVLQGGLAGIQASLEKHNKLLYKLLAKLEAKSG
jgi:hypothetical protein